MGGGRVAVSSALKLSLFSCGQTEKGRDPRSTLASLSLTSSPTHASPSAPTVLESCLSIPLSQDEDGVGYEVYTRDHLQLGAEEMFCRVLSTHPVFTLIRCMGSGDRQGVPEGVLEAYDTIRAAGSSVELGILVTRGRDMARDQPRDTANSPCIRVAIRWKTSPSGHGPTPTFSESLTQAAQGLGETAPVESAPPVPLSQPTRLDTSMYTVPTSAAPSAAPVPLSVTRATPSVTKERERERETQQRQRLDALSTLGMRDEGFKEALTDTCASLRGVLSRIGIDPSPATYLSVPAVPALGMVRDRRLACLSAYLDRERERGNLMMEGGKAVQQMMARYAAFASTQDPSIFRQRTSYPPASMVRHLAGSGQCNFGHIYSPSSGVPYIHELPVAPSPHRSPPIQLLPSSALLVSQCILPTDASSIVVSASVDAGRGHVTESPVSVIGNNSCVLGHLPVLARLVQCLCTYPEYLCYLGETLQSDTEREAEREAGGEREGETETEADGVYTSSLSRPLLASMAVHWLLASPPMPPAMPALPSLPPGRSSLQRLLIISTRRAVCDTLPPCPSHALPGVGSWLDSLYAAIADTSDVLSWSNSVLAPVVQACIEEGGKSSSLSGTAIHTGHKDEGLSLLRGDLYSALTANSHSALGLAEMLVSLTVERMSALTPSMPPVLRDCILAASVSINSEIAQRDRLDRLTTCCGRLLFTHCLGRCLNHPIAAGTVTMEQASSPSAPTLYSNLSLIGDILATAAIPLGSPLSPQSLLLGSDRLELGVSTSMSGRHSSREREREPETLGSVPTWLFGLKEVFNRAHRRIALDVLSPVISGTRGMDVIQTEAYIQGLVSNRPVSGSIAHTDPLCPPTAHTPGVVDEATLSPLPVASHSVLIPAVSLSSLARCICNSIDSMRPVALDMHRQWASIAGEYICGSERVYDPRTEESGQRESRRERDPSDYLVPVLGEAEDLYFLTKMLTPTSLSPIGIESNSLISLPLLVDDSGLVSVKERLGRVSDVDEVGTDLNDTVISVVAHIVKSEQILSGSRAPSQMVDPRVSLRIRALGSMSTFLSDSEALRTRLAARVPECIVRRQLVHCLRQMELCLGDDMQQIRSAKESLSASMTNRVTLVLDKEAIKGTAALPQVHPASPAAALKRQFNRYTPTQSVASASVTVPGERVVEKEREREKERQRESAPKVAPVRQRERPKERAPVPVRTVSIVDGRVEGVEREREGERDARTERGAPPVSRPTPVVSMHISDILGMDKGETEGEGEGEMEREGDGHDDADYPSTLSGYKDFAISSVSTGHMTPLLTASQYNSTQRPQMGHTASYSSLVSRVSGMGRPSYTTTQAQRQRMGSSGSFTSTSMTSMGQRGPLMPSTSSASGAASAARQRPSMRGHVYRPLGSPMHPSPGGSSLFNPSQSSLGHVSGSPSYHPGYTPSATHRDWEEKQYHREGERERQIHEEVRMERERERGLEGATLAEEEEWEGEEEVIMGEAEIQAILSPPPPPSHPRPSAGRASPPVPVYVQPGSPPAVSVEDVVGAEAGGKTEGEGEREGMPESQPAQPMQEPGAKPAVSAHPTHTQTEGKEDPAFYSLLASFRDRQSKR
ncbi:hypothetical protein KIPB_001097 [Kipferlia bialata]|uniref:Uncharacterized protein n=1 Tax=Kipferlia bialata TaxID=797122 RepID=A0A9K3CNH0_9EUKA|nr:hypothetical protein KIPB_001097 [Kipferlia bialata]|eukprot:g1097.t1